jgi:hypothetical protein
MKHKSSSSLKSNLKENDSSSSWSKKMKRESSKFKSFVLISSFKSSWNNIDVLVHRSMKGSEGFLMRKRQKSNKTSNRQLKDWALAMVKKKLWERNLTLWPMSKELFKAKLTSWNGNSKAKGLKNVCLSAKSTRSTFRLVKRNCRRAKSHLVFNGFVMRFSRKTLKFQLPTVSTSKCSTLTTSHC